MQVSRVDKTALERAAKRFGGSPNTFLIVPLGYDSYCKVLHPPSITKHGQGLQPVSWAELAKATDTVLNIETKGHDLSTAFRNGLGVEVSDPEVGSFTTCEERGSTVHYQLRVGELAQCLQADVGPVHVGFSALTSAHGDMAGKLASIVFPPDRKVHAGRVDSPSELDEGLESFTGSVWAPDLSWWITTDIDLDYTLVAGSGRSIGNIVSDPRFEALPLTPEELARWSEELARWSRIV